MTHAAPDWLPMLVIVAAAMSLWFAIFNLKRRVSLWSLFRPSIGCPCCD
jgi:hypothetical protein